MPTFKISQLPAVTSIAGTEELEVNQAGTSRKATRTQLVAGLAPQGLASNSGLTLSTNRLLGRSTAGSGAIEEIALGAGLTLSSGTLAATAAARGITLAATISLPNGGTSASVTGLATYTSFYIVANIVYSSGNDANFALSSNNGSSYGSDFRFATNAGVAQIFRTDAADTVKPYFAVRAATNRSECGIADTPTAAAVNAIRITASAAVFGFGGVVYIYGVN